MKLQTFNTYYKYVFPATRPLRRFDHALLRLIRRAAVLAISALLLVASHATGRADTDFDNWREQLWREAQTRGILRATFDAALRDFQLDLGLPDLVIPGRPFKEQAEFINLPATYLSDSQLSTLAKIGRRQLSTYRNVLDEIETKYGVPGSVIIAIWGRETDYGAEREPHNVIRSLITEAYLGRRKDKLREELLIALSLVQKGTIPLDARGSWTGAMGLTQFEPSDFLKFAVDGDGDGKIDLFNSVPDALASAGKQLRDYGWRRGKLWGFEVRIPQNIGCFEAAPDVRKPVSEWTGLGLTPAAGVSITQDMPADIASLVLPAGIYGPGFLALENFQVLRQYNASDLYAIFVGHLADLIDGGQRFERPWATLQPFSNRDTQEIQKRLSSRKYYSSEIDGRLGSVTRRAIGQYQKAANMRIDCWPSKTLLERLRAPEKPGPGGPLKDAR